MELEKYIWYYNNKRIKINKRTESCPIQDPILNGCLIDLVSNFWGSVQGWIVLILLFIIFIITVIFCVVFKVSKPGSGKLFLIDALRLYIGGRS